MATFSQVLKNIFFLLLIVQFAPMVISTIGKQYAQLFEQKTQVALIPLKSVLLSSQCTIKHLKKFFADPDIKAIVIAMDCPGGAAGTAQAIFQELKALKARYPKPVVVWVENICASGGYYIACAGDHIIATPSAFIGSIGVYIPLPQLKEFIEQFKLKYEPVSTGAYKLASDPFTATTAAQKEMLQGLTQDTYDQFIADVAQQRKLALNQARDWAEGRIFTGNQALKKGLIDEVGSPSSVENYLKEKIAIVGTLEYVKPPQQSNLSLLLGTSDECGDDSSFMESSARAVYSLLAKESTSIRM